MIDKGQYDENFVLRFTDFPLLVRGDTLNRLRAHEIFPNYQFGLSPDGPSFKYQGLKKEQYEKLGDFVIWDKVRNQPVAITRDDVGAQLTKKGLQPALDGSFKVVTVERSEERRVGKECRSRW